MDDFFHGQIRVMINENGHAAMLTKHSRAIIVGARRTLVAPADGQLFLRCADDWTQLADNADELNVTLRRTVAESAILVVVLARLMGHPAGGSSGPSSRSRSPAVCRL
jgi:hypothetical protein